MYGMLEANAVEALLHPDLEADVSNRKGMDPRIGMICPAFPL